MSRPPNPPRTSGMGPTPSPRRKGGEEATKGAFHCDLCGAPMLGRHCKLVCTGCGYMRDCSDP